MQATLKKQQQQQLFWPGSEDVPPPPSARCLPGEAPSLAEAEPYGDRAHARASIVLCLGRRQNVPVDEGAGHVELAADAPEVPGLALPTSGPLAGLPASPGKVREDPNLSGSGLKALVVGPSRGQ